MSAGDSDLWEQSARWWQATFTGGVDAEYVEQIFPLVSQHLPGSGRILDVGTGEGQVARLAAGPRSAVGVDRTWSQLVDHAYSHFVEPELIQPTIVYDWPLELSPFARTTDEDDSLVERFEAVVGGMEFANAFSELNDAEEQAQRFALQEAEREAGAEESEPGDPDFVEALSYGMPPTGGCGVGIDRLAMVLTGSDAIRDVILFPALRSR